jgi:CBS domain-containing protein
MDSYMLGCPVLVAFDFIGDSCRQPFSGRTIVPSRRTRYALLLLLMVKAKYSRLWVCLSSHRIHFMSHIFYRQRNNIKAFPIFAQASYTVSVTGSSIVFIFHLSRRISYMAASVVRDIMTKNIVMIEGDKTALEAAKVMAEKGISSVFVMKHSQPVGIVTERDFIKKVCAKELPIAQVKIGDIMSKILTTADPEMPIEVAVQRMVNHKIRRLPIIEAGKVVGIITVTDLAKHLRTTLLLEGALSDSNSFDNMIATMDHDKH